jgi:Ca-activated chloride channel family protein
MLLPAPKYKSNPVTPSLASRCLHSWHFFVVVCALAIVTAFLPANSRAQEPAVDDEVVRVSTDLLLFPIRIRHKRAQAATPLSETDLVLKDQDHVTTGLYFYPGADRVALVFALDQSGSLRQIILQQREAALALFGRFNERSRIAVIRFAEVASLVAPFGRDTNTARNAFDFPGRVNEHTAIFDAAAAAISAFDPLPRVRSERRIVILISDGLDNASRTKPGPVIDNALDKRVSFYVIHLPLFEPRNGRLAVRSPAKGFRDLAEKTGGKYFLAGDARSALEPSKEVDLAPVFQAIEDDLKSQYLLGFYLGETANDGRKHRFSLSLPANAEYQVGRLGYSRTHEFFVDRSRKAKEVQ